MSEKRESKTAPTSPASRARHDRLFSDEELEIALRKHLGIHSGAAKSLEVDCAGRIGEKTSAPKSSAS